MEAKIWAKIGGTTPKSVVKQVEKESTPPPVPLKEVEKDEEDLPPIPSSTFVESTPPPLPPREEDPLPREEDKQEERSRPSSSSSLKKKSPEQQQTRSKKPSHYRRQQQHQQSPAMRVSALQRALNDIFHSESHNVPNISIDQVRNEFMRYDGDRTGVVESSVFRRVIRDRLGWKISERAYKRLVSRLDTSRNRVDYTEFQAALAMSALALNRHTTTKVKTPPSPTTTTTTTTPHYSSFSKSKKKLNPTQRITRLKRILREMLQAQHVRTTDVSMRQVRDAFVSMDVRKRGFVTKPQFERALRFNLKWNNISSRSLESLYDLIEDEDEEHVDYTIFQASLAMLTRQSVTPISTTTTTTNTRPAVADLASASKAVRSVLYHSVTHRYTTQSIINTGTGTEERKQSLGCDCENCSNSNCESCVEC